MKLLVLLLLIGTVAAEQCEVLEIGTNAATTTGAGGASTRNHRMYIVRYDKVIYQIVPQRTWFPRLVAGRSVECRVKKDDIIIQDGYHYSIIAEKPVQ